jgi:ubiquinone biosynthesis protein UbiJ
MTDSSLRSLPTPALGAAEIALNRYLGNDPRALARCEDLAGRSLELRFSDLQLRLVFIAERHGMQLRGASDTEADVCLTGTSTAFGRILFSGGREGITGGGLRIEGDVGVAQRFSDLFASVDFDLADIIDARLGPVPAYFIGQGIKQARALFSRAAREFPEQTAEYLREETRDVIGPWEHEKFVTEIETLRDDAERLAARVTRLDSGSR